MSHGTPAYRKLHQRLRDQILGGEYEIGGLLPSENELSREYSINRMTVRQALKELVHEGLIEKRAGKGSIVTATRKTLGLLSFKGFSEVTGAREMEATTVNLEPATIGVWPSPFFYTLTDAEQKVGCIELKRLRSVHEHPVMVEHTFIPNLDLPGLVTGLQQNGSLFGYLQSTFKVEVQTLEQDIQAIGAPAGYAAHLQIEPHQPILHIYRKYGTSKKGLFIYSSLYCNTQKFTIGNTF